MDKNFRFLIIAGKTSSSKDTVCSYIEEDYGIKNIVSYTTRPKRSQETEGKEHWFIGKEEMSKIVSCRENLLSYDHKEDTDIEYCATSIGLSPGIYTYILNPKAILLLKELHPEAKIHVIYLDLDEETIKERAIKRGDSIEDINKRLDSEREEFDDYKNSKEYDYFIETNKSIDNIKKDIDRIFVDIFYKNI